MALSTYDGLWRAVLLRCPLAGPLLAQDWIKFAFRRIIERRRWSWTMKRGQFLLNNQYTTGNVDVTFNSNIVQGHSTLWTSVLVNRQFRIGLLAPIYTITAVDVALQQLTLDQVWGGNTTLATGYQIYNAYVTVPSDFHAFISVWDPQFNWQLWTNVKQEELNAWDSQRAQQGTAWVVAQMAYDTTVTPPLPRYEIWPHQATQKPYPFLYETRPPDLDDSGASLPRYIPGNVLLDGALSEAAMWPGPSKDEPNPYFNLTLAAGLERKFSDQVRELERQDDEVQMQDVGYQQLSTMPWASFTPLGDSSFLQSHAI